MKAIVIGGVAAGMSAASKLRRVKPDAQIVVYERGGFLSYGACGLPYYVGGFNDDPAKLIARTQAVYKEMRIETHLFHEVTRVDPERKTVTVRNLDTGAVFEDAYDVLMVATGCNSVNPKIPGADSPAVFYIKTMEDGLLLHEILRLRDVTRVAVVGGGDTACEEATYLASICRKVYMIVRKPHLRASKAMQQRVFSTPNIEVIFNHNTAEVLGDESGVTGALLRCNDGKEVKIDISGFFLAIGHHPNTELFRDQLQLDAEGYIKVEPGTSKTSVEGVFAAGDVKDPHYRQAITAAASGCVAALDCERFLLQ